MALVGQRRQRFNRPSQAFLRSSRRERLNVHYADSNAAGSYFVMVLFVAIGLALRPKRRRWFPAWS